MTAVTPPRQDGAYRLPPVPLIMERRVITCTTTAYATRSTHYSISIRLVATGQVSIRRWSSPPSCAHGSTPSMSPSPARCGRCPLRPPTRRPPRCSAIEAGDRSGSRRRPPSAQRCATACQGSRRHSWRVRWAPAISTPSPTHHAGSTTPLGRRSTGSPTTCSKRRRTHRSPRSRRTSATLPGW
jgi:hypothetical protein